MNLEEEFFENYYLDEEEIISYNNLKTSIHTLIKTNEFMEKCFKYLDEIIK